MSRIALTPISRESDRNDAALMDYAERLGNGAVFKRLGFLAGRNPAGGIID